MRAYVTRGPQQYALETVDLAEPREGELRIKLVSIGVCHTDIKAMGGLFGPATPVVHGHEGAGIVDKVGAGVEGFEVGDHVVLAVNHCGCCDECRAGFVAFCEDISPRNYEGYLPAGGVRITKDGEEIRQFFGQSSFAEYCVVEHHSCTKVDPDVDLRYLGPCGCGFLTGYSAVTQYLKAEPGTSAVVMGCGSIGCTEIMSLRLAGCSTIIAVGGSDKKLEFARELGATHTINRRNVESIADEIKKITGRGARYILDTTGNLEMIENVLEALGPRGMYAGIASVPGGKVRIPYRKMAGYSNSVASITFGNGNPHKQVPEIIEHFKAGRLPLDKLVSFYAFEDLEKGIQDSHDGVTIKPVLWLDSQ